MKQYLTKYKERFKTIFLISLVFLSIGQTAYYWLSSAYSTETTENNYRINPLFGAKEFNEKMSYQFSAPPITYLHAQSEIRFLPAKLTASSDTEPDAYHKLLLRISQTNIANIQPVNPSVDEWKKILTQSGVEFQYHNAVPLEQISAFFKWKYTSQQGIPAHQQVDRVWMTVPNAQGFAQVYMISSRSQNPNVYLATTNLPGEDLAKLIQNAKPLTTYTVSARYNTSNPTALLPNGNLYYVPTQPVKLAKVSYPVLQIEIQKMKEVLFEDPTLQPYKPREGWEIYAYGTRRTLFYDRIRKEMQYSGQTIDANPNVTPTELKTAVQKTNNFLKGHFGWTGDFHLDSFSTDKNEVKQLKFRQYDNGIPIFWENEESQSELPPTIIHMKPYITSNLNVVDDASFYHRSLYYWQPINGKKQSVTVTLPGAVELEQILKKHQIHSALVEQIQLVYLADWVDSSKKNSVALTPYWKVVVSGDGPSFPVKETIFYIGEGGQWIGEERKQY